MNITNYQIICKRSRLTEEEKSILAELYNNKCSYVYRNKPTYHNERVPDTRGSYDSIKETNSYFNDDLDVVYERYENIDGNEYQYGYILQSDRARITLVKSLENLNDNIDAIWPLVRD